MLTKHRNLPEKFDLPCPIFLDMRMFIFGLTFILVSKIPDTL